MGPLSSIVKTISDDVVSRLSDGGYPPLTDGKILYGRVEQFAESAPSRIIFTRTTSEFSMRDIYSRELSMTGERKNQNAMRAIMQKATSFEVRCWGADPSGLTVDNDDMTEVLVDAVIASIQSLSQGSFSIEGGEFSSSSFQSSQVMIQGSECVFGVTLLRPILAALAPYDSESMHAGSSGTTYHAPSDVAAGISDNLTITTGESEAGCEA